MCGITGYFNFYRENISTNVTVEHSINLLNKRGPDAKGIETFNSCVLGHTRLSIIDTSNAASQPMSDSTGRYSIVYNGEIFNFRELKDQYLKDVEFSSESDTEVLLYLYTKFGPDSLNLLNGFFAFAIHDNKEDTLFLAKDRFGIKPLLYFYNEKEFYFASELKALLVYKTKKTIDPVSLSLYLQLTYIPAPDTIFEDVQQLLPGHFIIIKNQHVSIHKYYQVPVIQSNNSSQHKRKTLFELMSDSVKKRLIADVPLGVFLSGGIDSSIITALAASYTKHLKTFSIGYVHSGHFDETKYANLVAEKYKTDHTVFKLEREDIIESIFELLEYLDEPFADSSAIAVYMLSKQTRKHVTVALSGDGADELFGGYNKHLAEYRVENAKGFINYIKYLHPLWEALPKSRNTFIGNKVRQIYRLSEGLKLSKKERYWLWCCFMNESLTSRLLKSHPFKEQLTHRKNIVLEKINENKDFNEILLTDVNFVLPNDMLRKVDLMSMANSLEVRVPFLDYRVVEFAFSLPVECKIDMNNRKKILLDTFKHLLPKEIYNRPKHGFEVPLLDIFRKELKSYIFDDILRKDLIEEQGIFNFSVIDSLKKKLFSANPGDVTTHIWTLVVFQNWYKKYFLA